MNWKCGRATTTADDGRKVITLRRAPDELKTRDQSRTNRTQYCLRFYSLNINPFHPSGLFYLNSLNRSISSKRCAWFLFFLLSCFIELHVFNGNCVDAHQMPSVSHDLDLRSLPMTFLLGARLKWVIEMNVITKTCLYKVDPLKPHFYIVKLGFTGSYFCSET